MAQQAEQQFRKLQVMGSNPIIGSIFGVWRSLVARFVRDEEVAGSNPVTPTTPAVSSRTLQVFLYLELFCAFDTKMMKEKSRL